MSPRARPARAVCFVVGGGRGRRSRVWSVRTARTGATPGRRVVLEVRGDGPGTGSSGGPAHTVRRGEWAVTLPGGLTVDVDPGAASVLGSSLHAPAPGWQVGALLVVPQAALSTPDGIALPAGCRRVSPPPRGHHVQVVLLLGEPDAIDLNLVPGQDVGSVDADGWRVQLWSHVVPTGPGTFGSRAVAETGRELPAERIPLVVDPGQDDGLLTGHRAAPYAE